MKKSILTHSFYPIVLAAAFGMFGSVAPALASGGSSGGGGTSGGTKPPVSNDLAGSSVLLPLSNLGYAYNNKFPAGSVTLSYAADGTAQGMTFSLSQINVPDGTVLPVQVIMGKLSTIFAYYAITNVVYTEVDGTITINHNSASLVLSKLTGDVIPSFAAPTAAATTEIRIMAPNSAATILDGTTGSFHA